MLQHSIRRALLDKKEPALSVLPGGLTSQLHPAEPPRRKLGWMEEAFRGRSAGVSLWKPHANHSLA